MPENTSKKQRNPSTQTGVTKKNHYNNSEAKQNEFCSYVFNYVSDSIFECGVFDYFDKDRIRQILEDPISYHEDAKELANFIYGKNGIVSNSIDYMTALMTLDGLIVNASKGHDFEKSEQNKRLMRSVLKTIRHKSFIRDALFTEMNNGIFFYYFEVATKKPQNSKYMSDYDVRSISEINEQGINASIITLPYKYTKIVGKKNGRYVLAFNLRYFDDYTGEARDKKLRKYPKEIRDGYADKSRSSNWLILDSDKTMCKKIKCKDSEPWGRPLALCALEDILYSDYFTDTKRNTLDEVNNRIIYQEFPQGEKKGSCALNKNQQENQHNKVKQAIMRKNNRGGTSFFSVASGTKIASMDISTDIFDDDKESSLDDTISLDLGICASLLGSMSNGSNFSSQQSNLQMITAQLYTWISEIQDEINHVIHKNIIKDDANRVEMYYFPVSFVNKGEFFSQMKDLYMIAGGSLQFLVAASGIDPDIYLSTLDYELHEDFEHKYPVHQTSYTYTGKNSGDAGRPRENDSTNESTIKSKTNGSVTQT